VRGGNVCETVATRDKTHKRKSPRRRELHVAGNEAERKHFPYIILSFSFVIAAHRSGFNGK
jgi:hypothetical protein